MHCRIYQPQYHDHPQGEAGGKPVETFCKYCVRLVNWVWRKKCVPHRDLSSFFYCGKLNSSLLVSRSPAEAQPTEAERPVFEKVSQALARAPSIIDELKSYEGAGAEIRQVGLIQRRWRPFMCLLIELMQKLQQQKLFMWHVWTIYRKNVTMFIVSIFLTHHRSLPSSFFVLVICASLSRRYRILVVKKTSSRHGRLFVHLF